MGGRDPFLHHNFLFGICNIAAAQPQEDRGCLVFGLSRALHGPHADGFRLLWLGLDVRLLTLSRT